jgi:uncharacterized membrane protein
MSMGRVDFPPMLILFRLIHILFGVFWAGTAIFNAIFLIPAVMALGPNGGAVMQEIAGKRKLPIYFLVAGFLTVLSGIGLYWHDSQGFTNDFMRSGGGMTFGIGGAIALITLLFGLFVVTPLAKRAGALGGAIAASGKPPTPEQGAEMKGLQIKLGKMGGLAAVLLTLTTIAMAIARYIP